METSRVKARSLWLAVLAVALAITAAAMALPQKALADDGVWKRLSGETALDTMSEIVGTGWTTADTVVLTTSEGYWDALTAAGLAGQVNAPVLMTDPSTLSAQTATLLGKLQPTTIVVVGGTSAVSSDVSEAAGKATGVTTEVKRVAGETAIGTANEVAAQMPFITKGTWADTAFVCTNDGYWDALAAAPIAFAKHFPIFLADGHKSITDETIQAMTKAGVKKVYLVGGESALTAAVAKQVENEGFELLGRLSGANAVETSEAVATYAIDTLNMSVNNMGVATTNGYWDALTGAALCGLNGAPLVLVENESSHSISGFITDNAANIYSGYLFGGTAAISEATATAIANAAPGGTFYTMTYVIPDEYSEAGYKTPYPVKVKPDVTLSEQGITLATADDVGAKEYSVQWYTTEDRVEPSINPATYKPTGDFKVYMKVNPYFTVKVMKKTGKDNPVVIAQKEYTKTSFNALKSEMNAISAVWDSSMYTAIEYVTVASLVNDATGVAGAWDKYVEKNPNAVATFIAGCNSYSERKIGQLAKGTYGKDFGDATYAAKAMPAAFGIKTSDALAWGTGTEYATPFAGQTYLGAELAKTPLTARAPQAIWGPESDEDYATSDKAFLSNCTGFTITLTMDVSLVEAESASDLVAGSID